MAGKSWKHCYLLIGAALLSAPAEGTPAATDCSASNRAGFGTTPSIQCPVLPEAPYVAAPANSPQQASVYEDWAWKSFVALNWPATPTPTQRGVPDKGQTFAGAGNDSQGTWETWKEKRELFIDSITPADWNAAVDYPDNRDIPACPGQADVVAALGKSHRHFAQAGKALSLDEALQVPSESGPHTTVAGTPVQPQVWHGVRSASGENSVLYEVKLNYDYYAYVVAQKLYDDTTKNQRRMSSGSQNFQYHDSQGKNAISLPWRSPPPGASPSDGMYSVADCESNPVQNGYPCQAGAVQTKAAWRRITASEKPDFHWTAGIYYREIAKTGPYKDGICKAVGDFGLIGLHIIQKTFYHGHYIFATWEHKSVSTDLYTYAEKPVTSAGSPAKPMAPAFPDGIKVNRDHDILPSTRQTNDTYHRLIGAANSQSVWLKYQLVGVQYIPVECWAAGNQACAASGFQVGLEDPTNNGQPFYLANLVIETNWGLQNFQGVPPGPPGPYLPVGGFAKPRSGVKPNDHYLPNPTPNFNRSLGNTGHSRRNRGQVFNMGGCMGCHGVAMSLGTDFSFALLFGQQGADSEGANQEQLLGPPSYGSDLSLQNTTDNFGPSQFLGIGDQQQVIVTSGKAEQQFVLVNPDDPDSLAPLSYGSVVALRSTTRGGYLLATAIPGDGAPVNTWKKVTLAPDFSDSAARWTILPVSTYNKPKKVPPGTPVGEGDRFCLSSNKLIGGAYYFLSRYGQNSAGIIGYCDTRTTSWEHWALQQPFAPLN